MEIKIDIEDDEFRRIIQEEIEVVVKASDIEKIDDLVIIVPEKFDEAVVKVSGDESYKSRRTDINRYVMGITFRDKQTIIFNSKLYYDFDDLQIRFSIYLHEFFHLNYTVNRVPFKVYDKKYLYMSFIELQREEFLAIRYGLKQTKELFGKDISEMFISFIQEAGKGHLKNLLDKEIYHENLKSLIHSYKVYDITFDDFLNEVTSLIHKYSLEIISFCNYIEIYSNYFNLNLPDDILFNSDTKVIYEILKMGTIDYNSEIESKLDRFFLRFGLTISDIEEGLYYGVNYLKI